MLDHNCVKQRRLDAARSGGSELSVDFHDTSNAFGSISHKNIAAAMRGSGAGQAFAELVVDVIRDNTSCAVAADDITADFFFRFGIP